MSGVVWELLRPTAWTRFFIDQRYVDRDENTLLAIERLE